MTRVVMTVMVTNIYLVKVILSLDTYETYTDQA